MERKKIEYRVEGIDVKNFNDEKSITEIKGFLSELGEDGWDLVNVISTSQQKEGIGQNYLNVKKSIFIFKRITN